MQSVFDESHRTMCAFAIAVLSCAAMVSAPVAPSGAAPASKAKGCVGEVRRAREPRLPLHTDGRWIVGRDGKRVKLAGVNWFGAESPDELVGGLGQQPVDAIARCVADLGFNTVRLPFSNQMLRDRRAIGEVITNRRPLPGVSDPTLAERGTQLLAGIRHTNPALLRRGGKQATPLDAYVEVVRALARHHLMVVLDDHQGQAQWCCGEGDDGGLWSTRWYENSTSREQWRKDWLGLLSTVDRRLGQDAKWVVGVDLRNEPRGATTWGTWKRASEEVAGRILERRADRDLLVFVEGPVYSLQFADARTDPLAGEEPLRSHLVYAPHDYSNGRDNAYAELPDDSARLDLMASRQEGSQWGFLMTPCQGFTRPVWIGEFGTAHDARGLASPWFQTFVRYLRSTDADWAWWPLNGTIAYGRVRSRDYDGNGVAQEGREETFGVLDTKWDAPASAELVRILRSLEAPTQGPGAGKGAPRCAQPATASSFQLP